MCKRQRGGRAVGDSPGVSRPTPCERPVTTEKRTPKSQRREEIRTQRGHGRREAWGREGKQQGGGGGGREKRREWRGAGALSRERSEPEEDGTLASWHFLRRTTPHSLHICDAACAMRPARKSVPKGHSDLGPSEFVARSWPPMAPALPTPETPARGGGKERLSPPLDPLPLPLPSSLCVCRDCARPPGAGSASRGSTSLALAHRHTQCATDLRPNRHRRRLRIATLRDPRAPSAARAMAAPAAPGSARGQGRPASSRDDATPAFGDDVEVWSHKRWRRASWTPRGCLGRPAGKPATAVAAFRAGSRALVLRPRPGPPWRTDARRLYVPCNAAPLGYTPPPLPRKGRAGYLASFDLADGSGEYLRPEGGRTGRARRPRDGWPPRSRWVRARGEGRQRGRRAEGSEGSVATFEHGGPGRGEGEGGRRGSGGGRARLGFGSLGMRAQQPCVDS